MHKGAITNFLKTLAPAQLRDPEQLTEALLGRFTVIDKNESYQPPGANPEPLRPQLRKAVSVLKVLKLEDNPNAPAAARR
jgi:hypothetical protein